MIRGISEVAGQQDCCSLQQRRVVFLRPLKSGEEVIQSVDDGRLDEFKLRDVY